MITKHRIQPKREHKKFVRQAMVDKISNIKKAKSAPTVKEKAISEKKTSLKKEEKIQNIFVNDVVEPVLEEQPQEEVIHNEEPEEPIKKPSKKTNRKKKDVETENNE